MLAGSGRIYLNKLAAAQRQLCAAIRLFFAGEDELAVHTVASAAYRVLSDLRKSGVGMKQQTSTSNPFSMPFAITVEVRFRTISRTTQK
jgi:hypothetical protein